MSLTLFLRDETNCCGDNFHPESLRCGKVDGFCWKNQQLRRQKVTASDNVTNSVNDQSNANMQKCLT